jgi:hypothetical protein
MMSVMSPEGTMSAARSSNGFWRSSGGRLALAAAGLAVAAAGGVALGGESLAAGIVATVPLVCAVGFIVAVGLSIEEYGAHCVVLLLALPPLGGVFLFSLSMLDRGGRTLGLVLLVLGLLGLARAAFRGTPAAAATSR